LLTESLLLASAGGVLALAIAWWGGAALVRMISIGDSPIPLDIHPDWRIFSFAAAVSLATGALFGLAPALRGTRLDPGEALKEGGRATTGSARRLDRFLVAAQVTLSVILIAAAGLFSRTVANLRGVDTGFSKDNVLMFSVDAKLAGYSKQRADELYRSIVEKSAALPGIQSAAVSIVRPIDDQYFLVDRIREVDGRRRQESDNIRVAWNALGPGYFATISTPLLLGREFEPRDAGTRVVVINEYLARQAFPGGNPIGHKLDGAEVIGVAKDSLYADPHGKPRAILYRPFFRAAADPSQWLGGGPVSFELRTSTPNLVNEIRHTVASIDPNVPIFRIKTLRAQTEDAFLRERLLATISTFFGALALLLACLGLYGLMAYAVARRTAEIGIRMALGAGRGGITWLVLGETLWLMLAGSAAGVPLAAWLSRYAKSLLFGIEPADPRVLAVSVCALILVAAVAALLPARRATRIDPMVALRYE
jgi:predicted permease